MPQHDERLGALPLTVPDPFGLADDPTRLSSERPDGDETGDEMRDVAPDEGHPAADDGNDVRLGELD